MVGPGVHSRARVARSGRVGLKGARPTSASIDLGALAANHRRVERLAAGREVIAVVKADAYGHGASAVARRLVDSGCRRLAVVTVAEATALRDAGIGVQLLVLGGIHDAAEAQEVVGRGLTATLHHPGQVALLSHAARSASVCLPVHVEIDTGMRRMGVPTEAASDFLSALKQETALQIEGIFTHLACADDEDPAASRQQLVCFGEVLEQAARRGIVASCVHVANSAALLASATLPDGIRSEVGGTFSKVGGTLSEVMPSAVNAVRPGLLLYGARSSPHGDVDLKPVMTLRTRVVQVRRVAPGDAVGYGWTWRSPHSGFLATLPIGYEDGLPWSASNRGAVWLRGRRADLVGRVSMDFVTADVGEGPVEIGDEAIVFGQGPPGTPSVEEAAQAAGTIPYELLVRVGARVPRVVSE